jgi:hypothetical protein
MKGIFSSHPRVSFLSLIFPFVPCLKPFERVFRSFSSSNLEQIRKTYSKTFFQGKKNQKSITKFYSRERKGKFGGYKRNIKGGKKSFHIKIHRLRASPTSTN